MEVLYGPNYELEKKTVIAFGKFDGIHKGHVKLINTLVNEAKEDNALSVVYTFLNHPKTILGNEDLTLLMDNKTKIERINKLGVDILIFEKFTKGFADLTPEKFVSDILKKRLNVYKIVMGSNSTFGKNSIGDIKMMKELSKKYNFKVIEVELVKENGKIISSSQIREELALRGGNVN